MSAEALDGDLAETTGAATSVSLRRLLMSFFNTCGGPEGAGEVLGGIFMDPGVNVQTRVRVADIATRLVGQHIQEEAGEGLETPEMIEEEIRRLAGK